MSDPYVSPFGVEHAEPVHKSISGAAEKLGRVLSSAGKASQGFARGRRNARYYAHNMHPNYKKAYGLKSDAAAARDVVADQNPGKQGRFVRLGASTVRRSRNR